MDDGGSAAYDVLSLLGEEQRHHPVAVVTVARRTEKYVHRLPSSYLDHTCGGVVSRLIPIQLVALVHKHGCKRLGGIPRRIDSLA